MKACAVAWYQKFPRKVEKYLRFIQWKHLSPHLFDIIKITFLLNSVTIQPAVTLKSFIHPEPSRMTKSTCTYLLHEQEKEILSKCITNTNASESTVHAFMLQRTRSNKQPLFLLNWCVLGCKIVSSVCYLEASPSVETSARVAEGKIKLNCEISQSSICWFLNRLRICK